MSLTQSNPGLSVIFMLVLSPVVWMRGGEGRGGHQLNIVRTMCDECELSS
jgi:hypothetical protein